MGTAGRVGCVVVAALLPSPALALRMSQELARGKSQIYGWVDVEAEDYQTSRGSTSTGSSETHRKRLRESFDINGGGYIWDRRFATFSAGVTLSRETTRTGAGETTANLVGFRFNSQWLLHTGNPLLFQASRSKSTVADFWSPSYDVVTTNVGLRWSFDNAWVGRTRLSFDSLDAESTGGTVLPRSDTSRIFGIEGGRQFIPKRADDEILTRFQHGQTDLTWGYRRNTWGDNTRGSHQTQDYFYLQDRTRLGQSNNLNATMMYFQRDDAWNYGGALGGNRIQSSHFNAQGQLLIQETEDLQHSYNLAVNSSTTGESESAGYSAGGSVAYQFNDNWRASANLGYSSSQSKSTGLISSSQSMTSSQAGGNINYNTRVGSYMLRAGYMASLRNSSASASGTTTGTPWGGTGSTHSIDAAYSRIGSAIFSDSLQLRLSYALGDFGSQERSATYTVNSLLGENDVLYGIAEYRNYTTDTPVLVLGTVSTYQTNSTTSRGEVNWTHRLGAASTLTVGAGASKAESNWIQTQTRYGQVRLSAMLASSLQFNAMGRRDQIDGYEGLAGTRTTIESDVLYRIGKWQANARYRYRDAQSSVYPFKERSIFFLLRRDYGFRL